MIMNREIISDIIKNGETQLEFLNKISSISPNLIKIFDNEYVNGILDSQDMILRLYLGDALYNDVMWYLYDRPREENGDDIVYPDKQKVYTITDLNSFLDYLEDCDYILMSESK